MTSVSISERSTEYKFNSKNIFKFKSSMTNSVEVAKEDQESVFDLLVSAGVRASKSSHYKQEPPTPSSTLHKPAIDETEREVPEILKVELAERSSMEEPSAEREELIGFVKKIMENEAIVAFEIAEEPIERIVPLYRLKAANAAYEGALIVLDIEGKGASFKATFRNLEGSGISTWRDKISDEQLKRYDELRDYSRRQKPTKLQ